MIQKILILGDGYVGNYIFNYLSKKNLNVIKKSYQELNYHDEKKIKTFILKNQIEAVINCSGFTGKPNIDEAESKKELCWRLNVTIPLQINKVCNLTKKIYIHISSGCIYDGYHKEWEENDNSNFGLFSNESSFYSKTKHAFEILSENMENIILRIRMPFSDDLSSRNYLIKIKNYENLIQYKNSKTYIPDLCGFVFTILKMRKKTLLQTKEIYNVVNPKPLWTNEVCDIMKEYDFYNKNWKFVKLESLKILAGRSNCVLSNKKASKLYKFKTERCAIRECLKKIENRE